jgi:inorganic pyrophosphatase
VPCRVIGVLNIEQTNLQSKRRERNDRIAVLPTKAPRQEGVASVFDLTERIRAEIEQFFLQPVAFEGKELALLGWEGPLEAKAVVQTSAQAIHEGLNA